jgi:hypothetical protein
LGAFAATQIAYFLLWQLFGGPISVLDWLRILVPLAAYLLLALIRKPLLDYIIPLLLIAFYVWRYWEQTLAA